MQVYLKASSTTSGEILDFYVRFFGKCCARDRVYQLCMPIARDSKYRRQPNFSTMETGERRWKIFEDRVDAWVDVLYRSVVGMWPESRNALDTLPLPIPRLVAFTRTSSSRSFDLSREMGTWRSGFTSGKFISSCRKCHSRIFTVNCRGRFSHDIEIQCEDVFLKKHKRQTNPYCRSKEFFSESYTNVPHTIDNDMFLIASE